MEKEQRNTALMNRIREGWIICEGFGIKGGKDRENLVEQGSPVTTSFSDG